MKPGTHSKFIQAGLFGLLAVAVSACASGPGGPGGHKPPPGGEGGPPRGEDTPTGFAAKPIIFVLLELDANKDRAVTIAEMEAGLGTVWAQIDTDQTGTVTPIEYGIWAQANLGDDSAHPTRIAIDTNLDGGITRAEFDARMRHEFREMDKNADQILTRQEMIFRLPSQRMGMQGGPGGGMGGRGGGQGMPPRGGGEGGRR